MRREESSWNQAGFTKGWWKALGTVDRKIFLAELTDLECEQFFRDWMVWAHDYQIAPETDWDTWLFLAGRGSGKTRSAVEYILDGVNAGWARRIAIVGQGEDDVRQVMIEGEALALDTPIPTPTGWVAFGDLEPGDSVFARDGSITKVVGVTPIWTDRPCYAVVADGAKPIIADENHKWVTSSRAERRKVKRESIRTTGEMFPDVRKRRADLVEFELPMTDALQLPEIRLAVPPYTLGAWLGDGDTRGHGTFTCHHNDVETIENIRADGFKVNARAGSYAWGILGLKVHLVSAGLAGRKFIPRAYLRASYAQRLALLQGLMDTDGYVSDRGQCSFDNTNQELVCQVRELMLTLGYKPGPVASKIDKRGFKTMYRVTLHGGKGAPAPFRLARKVARYKVGIRPSGRLVREIERVDSVPVRCIQVAHETGTFLAGEDMVVTHNSGFLECSPSWNKPKFYPSVGGGQLIWPNGCVAFIYSAADTEALRGPQFHLGWFDEPMAVPRAQRERALDNLEFCLRLGVHPQLILTTTPKKDPWLRQMEKDAADPEKKIHLSRATTYDNADNLASNFLRKIERKYGGTRIGKQEILGKILGDEEGALWTEETIENCRKDKDGRDYTKIDPIALSETCAKIIISVDPNLKDANGKAKKTAHAAGIVVVASRGRERFVLADRTIGGGPTKWGKAAVDAALEFDADEICAEAQQGGEMVRIVVRQAMLDQEVDIPVHLNYTKKSKEGRAEPVATMYERGMVHHVGPEADLELLETQMLYIHEGQDPTGEDFDRCDALVWGLTRLGVKRRFLDSTPTSSGFGIMAMESLGNA